MNTRAERQRRIRVEAAIRTVREAIVEKAERGAITYVEEGHANHELDLIETALRPRDSGEG